MLDLLDGASDPIDDLTKAIKESSDKLNSLLYDHVFNIIALEDLMPFSSDSSIDEMEITDEVKAQFEEYSTQIGVCRLHALEMNQEHTHLQKNILNLVALLANVVTPNLHKAMANTMATLITQQNATQYNHPVRLGSETIPTEVFNTSMASANFDRRQPQKTATAYNSISPYQ